jgi:hypothetical protein
MDHNRGTTNSCCVNSGCACDNFLTTHAMVKVLFKHSPAILYWDGQHTAVAYASRADENGRATGPTGNTGRAPRCTGNPGNGYRLTVDKARRAVFFTACNTGSAGVELSTWHSWDSLGVAVRTAGRC